MVKVCAVEPDNELPAEITAGVNLTTYVPATVGAVVPLVWSADK
jgi:hypothetical protein